MSASSTASPPEDLASVFEEWKYGHGKNLIIAGSSAAIVSVVASALLVWILFRSRNGIATTYHQMLLGLSVSDIVFSLGNATFGAAVPSELNYVVWNARGNRASCDALGFIQALSGYSGLLYMCSLNLYYLAKVKYNKTDIYIAKKLELWLHLVPTLSSLAVSVALLAKHAVNADIDSDCNVSIIYEPPHCDGYEDGDIPEGFEIPCGRGRSAEFILAVPGVIVILLVPITIGGSLLTIYRSVSKAEQKISRYGAGSLQTSRARPTTNDAATTDAEGGGGGGWGAFSIALAIRRSFQGRASRTNSDNRDSSQSSAVLHKAAAYSVGYFVTWIWLNIYAFLFVAGVVTNELPRPKWQIAYLYAMYFFTPLQGLWTFIIYMQPNVIKRKRSSDGNISWFRAFSDALRSAVAGPANPDGSGRDRAGPGAPRTAAPPGRTGTNPNPAPGHKRRNTSATTDSTDQQGNEARVEAMGIKAEDPEEEKRGIQEEDDPSV